MENILIQKFFLMKGMYLILLENLNKFHFFLTLNKIWIHPKEILVNDKINERAMNLTGIQFEGLLEATQILKYETGGHYHAHHDYFCISLEIFLLFLVPDQYPNHKDIQQGQQRLLTIFIYLSNVEDGGETVFPLGNIKTLINFFFNSVQCQFHPYIFIILTNCYFSFYFRGY